MMNPSSNRVSLRWPMPRRSTTPASAGPACRHRRCNGRRRARWKDRRRFRNGLRSLLLPRFPDRRRLHPNRAMLNTALLWRINRNRAFPLLRWNARLPPARHPASNRPAPVPPHRRLRSPGRNPPRVLRASPVRPAARVLPGIPAENPATKEHARGGERGFRRVAPTLAASPVSTRTQQGHRHKERKEHREQPFPLRLWRGAWFRAPFMNASVPFCVLCVLRGQLRNPGSIFRALA